METGNPMSSTTGIFLVVLLTILLVFGVFIYHFFRDRKLLKSVTSLKRGTASERDLVLRLLKKGMPAITIFHDLCIEKRNGSYSQIDIVLPTKEGIVVFEVKDYKGWIFGDGHRTTWMKTLNYGKIKNRFYNPIKQNLGHIKAIRSLHSQFKYVPFYSVIVFYGECELKEINYIPAGTYLAKADRVFDVLREIKEQNAPASYRNKKEVVRVLQEAVQKGADISYQERHIANIKDMMGKHRVYK